jgi:hypothetical protein
LEYESIISTYKSKIQSMFEDVMSHLCERLITNTLCSVLHRDLTNFCMCADRTSAHPGMKCQVLRKVLAKKRSRNYDPQQWFSLLHLNHHHFHYFMHKPRRWN